MLQEAYENFRGIAMLLQLHTYNTASTTVTHHWAI